MKISHGHGARIPARIANMVGFRNMNHLLWFCCTITILVMSVLHNAPAWTLLVLTASHAYTASFAWYVLRVQHQDSVVVSTDCIWFNSGLAVVYLFLAALQLSR